MSRTLQFGETPFDSLSPAEMRTVVLKLYVALMSAHSVMDTASQTTRQIRGHDPYWHDSKGAGHKAVSMAKEVLGKISDGRSSENIYRSFFGLAGSVLFDCITLNGGTPQFCPTCRAIFSLNDPRGGHAGSPCGGEARPLTIADLESFKDEE